MNGGDTSSVTAADLPAWGSVAGGGGAGTVGGHGGGVGLDRRQSAIMHRNLREGRRMIFWLGVAVGVALVLAVGEAFIFGSDMWENRTFRQNQSDVLASLGKARRRIYFELNGKSQEGICQTDGGRNLLFHPRFDPDGVYASVKDQMYVIAPETGHYSLHMRAVVHVNRSTNNLSCDIAMKIKNSTADGPACGVAAADENKDTTFGCPKEAQAGALVSWSTTVCLERGHVVELKTPQVSGVFRCDDGQRLTLTGRLETETDKCECKKKRS